MLCKAIEWLMSNGRLAFRIFIYAYIALFFVGVLTTFAKRFDEGRIEEAIVDGLDLLQVNDELYLAVRCKGQDMGYKYDLRKSELRVIPAVQAAQQPSGASSLSKLFPVTKQDIAVAVGLVGGSVGLASRFDRLRIAATEFEKGSGSRRIGFKPLSDMNDFVEQHTSKLAVLLEPLLAVGVGVAGTVSGYFLGVFIAEKLMIDVDCTSRQLHQKLSMPNTWRSLLGTVFTRTYAYLLPCIYKHQFRTLMPAAPVVFADKKELRELRKHGDPISKTIVVDYADAPDSASVGRLLSRYDWTLKDALTKSGSTCDSRKRGSSDDTSTDAQGFPQNLDPNPSCWTQPDIENALAKKKARLPAPLTTDTHLSEQLISREFPPSEKERLYPRPTLADAFVKTMERLGKGKLLNEKGEATIDIVDIRLLLNAKQSCETQAFPRGNK